MTVPASFDEVARSLTAEAAEAAGLGNVTLLEEPQAAFYAWTARAGREWRDAVAPGDIILVCDVGGGTADFSLIAVTDVAGNLELERISVGEHILLGGDNMDLALAYTLQARLEAEGKSLDAWQFLALVHAASRAKITLFEDTSLAEAPIAVPSRGSSLFAKTIATALDRASLSQVVLDGFFAQTALDDLPREARRTGLQEFGLPYASDPVISKHLARFLTRSLQNVKASDKLARAGRTAGRWASADADRRVVQWRRVQGRRRSAPGCWTCWRPGMADRRFASSRGSSRISRSPRAPPSTGGIVPPAKACASRPAPRAPTISAWKRSMPAIPGFRPPVKALCVVPQGMQEGTELLIEGRTFGLVTGQAAEFRFFSSAVRSGDTPGQILPDAERELEETSLLEVELPALPDAPAGQVVPVRIESVVTELGTLELWMKHTNSDRRWKIEFQVRTE